MPVNYQFYLLLTHDNGKPALARFDSKEDVCTAHRAIENSWIFGVENELEGNQYDRLICGEPVMIQLPAPAPVLDYPMEIDP